MVAVRTIKLNVFSDFLCPWCYVGHVELERAVAKVQSTNLPAAIEIRYRPYTLNPSLNCEESVVKEDFYVNKFGIEKWEGIKNLLQDRALKQRFNFSFGGNMRQTTHAHRMIEKAWRIGGQDTQQTLLKELFQAFYEQEKDIGDINVLVEYAEAAGFSTKAEALEFLRSDELREEVLDACAKAPAQGVTGVPFIIINGKWIVSGVHATDVYFKIFEKFANTETPVLLPQPSPATTCK